MEENIEVNKEELMKQMKDDLLKGYYAKAEIIVGEVPKQPFCAVKIHGVTNKEVGVLYRCLEEAIKSIKDQYPLAVEYAEKWLQVDGRIDIV